MKILLIACITLFSGFIAQADTLITLENTDAEMPDKILIKNGRVLITEPARERRMIFDTNSSSMYIVNDKQREYTVINEAYMENVGSMLNSMQSVMAGLMGQVPEEQRAQLEEMMGTEINNQPEPVDVKIVKTGKSKQISGFNCDILHLKENNVTTNTVCVATAKEVKMSANDYATLIKMGGIINSFVDKFSQIAGEYSDSLVAGGKIINQINGIPLEIVNGNNRSIMSSIKESAIANSVFGLSGYQQIDPLQMQ